MSSESEDREETAGSRYERFRHWVVEAVVHPITEMEAGQVGNCVSVGLWGGIFPIPGATTLAVLVMCWILPVHFSTAMQSVAVAMNVLITPVQWGVFPVFVIYGSYFLEDTVCDPVSIIEHFANPKLSFIATLQSSSACIAGGCLVWTAIGVPFIILVSTVVTYSVRVVRAREMNMAYSTVSKTERTDVEMNDNDFDS